MKPTEHSITEKSIQLSGGKLLYILERKAVKNLNLRILPDGTVHLSAHRRVSQKSIDAFLTAKQEWIYKALARLRARPEIPRPSVYAEGETFMLWGEPLALGLRAGSPAQIRREEGRLILTLPDPTDEKRRAALFERWMREECLGVFQQISGKIAPAFEKIGIASPILQIKNTKSRWGSCQPGKRIITLSSRLISVPIPCVEYVVLHEFVHLIHPNHSPAFHAAVRSVMPDEVARRALLRQYANAMQP